MQQLYLFALTLLVSALPHLALAQPTNDDCANAIAVGIDATTARNFNSFNTTGATTTFNDAGCTTTSDDDDIWYTFVATDDIIRIFWQNVVNSDPNSGFGFSLLEGDGCGNLTTLRCSAFASSANDAGLVTFNDGAPLTPGATYYLRLFSGGVGNSMTGEFTLLGRAANDMCDNATPITPNEDLSTAVFAPFNTSNSLSSATIDCGNRRANWYSFTSGGGVTLLRVENFVATDNSLGFAYELREGECSSSTAPVGCRFFVNSTDYTIALNGGAPLIAGQTYHLQAFQNGAARATGEIAILERPANDNCTEAVTIAAQPTGSTIVYTTFNTALATESTPSPSCTGSSADDDIWYSFVATTERAFLSYRNYTPENSGSTGLGYELVEDCTAATSIGCDFSIPATNGAGQQVIPSTTGGAQMGNLVPGTTYLLRIYAQGGGGAGGEFAVITVPNDDCAGAVTFPVSAPGACTFTTVSTEFATRSAIAPSCTGISADDDVWYSFTPTSETVRLSFTNFTPSTGTSSTSLGYTVHTACPDGAANNEVLCNFDVVATNGMGEEVLQPTGGFVINQPYLLRLFFRGDNNSGRVDVCLETLNCVAPDVRYGQINFADCSGGGTPNLEVVVNDLGSASSLTITNDGGASPINVTTPGTYTLTDFPGEGRYSVVVEHDGNSDCNVDLGEVNVFCRADNNSCDDARDVQVNALGDNTNTAMVKNFFATNSTFPNDPSCGNYAGGDLWYRFTAGAPEVVVNIISSEYSSLAITAYTDDCTAGTEIDCGFAGSGTYTLSGFTAGETYLLRAYDFGDNQFGFAEFSLQQDASLPAELTAFTGRAEAKQNVLSWTTATETGVDHFLLEAGVDNGNGGWETVGRISAANIAGQAQTYELAHHTPGVETYYRLTTVDYDGTRQLSDVISVRRAAGLENGGFLLTPNPAVGTTELRFMPAAGTAQMTLHDITGRQLQRRMLAAGAGRVTLDLQGLVPGAYLVRLQVGEATYTQRLIKR